MPEADVAPPERFLQAPKGIPNLDWVARLITGGAIERWPAGSPLEVSSQGPAWEWQLTITGLRAAVTRYEDLLGRGSGFEARAAVGEALWWLASLDEFVTRLYPAARSKTRSENHCAMLNETRIGRVVGGLVFLRNRTNHQLASALVELERVQVLGPDGNPPKVRYPDGTTKDIIAHASIRRELRPRDQVPISGLSFSPLEDLPEPDGGFKERLGRDLMYEEEVASRPVGAVLDAVIESIGMVFDLTIETSDSGDHYRFHMSSKR